MIALILIAGWTLAMVMWVVWGWVCENDLEGFSPPWKGRMPTYKNPPAPPPKPANRPRVNLKKRQ